MATIEIPDDWLESTGLSLEEARDYLLTGYPVMVELCQFHMGSTFIRTPLNSVIGHAHVILGGIDGPVTGQQKEDLGHIIHAAEFLMKRLTLFLYVVSSIFKHHTIYPDRIDIREVISSMVPSTGDYQFEIKYPLDGAVSIQSDRFLFEKLLFGILEIATHIPHKGVISISVEQGDTEIFIKVVTTQDEKYPFELSRSDPTAFMVQSLAKELQGGLKITHGDSAWQIVTTLPITLK